VLRYIQGSDASEDDEDAVLDLDSSDDEEVVVPKSRKKPAAVVIDDSDEEPEPTSRATRPTRGLPASLVSPSSLSSNPRQCEVIPFKSV
jgi:hypothetical protein